MEGTKARKGYSNALIVPYGDTFPASPLYGQLFYHVTNKALYIFIGVGEPGTTSGWFNLKQAVYAP